MAQGDKSAIYQALKRADYAFEKHYREYTTDELAAIAREQGLEVTLPEPVQPPIPTSRPSQRDELAEQVASLSKTVAALAQLVTPQQRAEARRPIPTPQPVQHEPQPEAPKVKPAALDPSQHAGVTLNSHQDDEVVEIDEHGNLWYQKEVVKPDYPKPRGRRVLRYEDPGVKKETVLVDQNGVTYTETFEVAGEGRGKAAEIKVTLPSYQTGIYKSPTMPFKIHTYRGAAGFDLRDVQDFYGGSDLVPSTIKRCYVSNDLCYDIQSTIRTIENEYRELTLRGGRVI